MEGMLKVCCEKPLSKPAKNRIAAHIPMDRFILFSCESGYRLSLPPPPELPDPEEEEPELELELEPELEPEWEPELELELELEPDP
jgi:hypothetical protein